MKRILLVEPEFPFSTRSRNHSDFLPIGLLKLASYYRKQGNEVQLLRGLQLTNFNPDRILITSLFTYWAVYVKDAVEYYKKLYPNAICEVGGIYATLLPQHCKSFTGCDKVVAGLHKGAEKCKPAYDLVEVNYQVIHGMRGCSRKCPFCGIWKLENKSFKNAKQIKNEIVKNKLIFYDNNILINPFIKEILLMLERANYQGKPVRCECQSGFDGRELAKNPEFARLIKNARFEKIRLAWDFSYEQFTEVEKWIDLLVSVGYRRSEIFIFMVYNWSFDYEELERKRQKCFEWGVQIADCRFRPLDQTLDNYSPNSKSQTGEDYYIHSNWTDEKIRIFRRSVRKHNICLRYKIPWDKYEQKLERQSSKNNLAHKMDSLNTIS